MGHVMIDMELVQRAYDLVMSGRSTIVDRNTAIRMLQKAYMTEFFTAREAFVVDAILASAQGDRNVYSGTNEGIGTRQYAA